MNLYRKGIGLLGLMLLLLAVSAGGCEGTIRQLPRIIKVATEFIEHEKIPAPVLQKIAADTHVSSDNLPGLAEQISESVPESTVEQDVKMETNGLDAETANKDIADACKLAERLSGEPSGDSSQADKVTSIKKTLENTKDSLAVSTICHVADFLES